MNQFIRQNMLLALLVLSASACKAKTEMAAGQTVKPSEKAATAERAAAAIAQEHYARRACWHEKRVQDLTDNESLWRARRRHAEKAAAWWKSLESETVPYKCTKPIAP